MSFASPVIFNFADMRFVANLQQNQPVVDASGGQTDNFVTIVTARVSLVKLSGADGFPSEKMEYIKKYTLVCRIQKAFGLNSDGQYDFHNITADTRWLIRGEQYDIDDFDELPYGNPHFVTMHLTKNEQ
jgi:hypothetical protein